MTLTAARTTATTAKAMSPIGARCRRCRQDFLLLELLDDRTGRCPRCTWRLSPDWTTKLLADAERADREQRRFVTALRSLRNVPGNAAIRPHTILENLFEAVGWQQDMAEDRDLLRDELHELRRLLMQWELLDPVVAAAQPRQSWPARALRWFMGTGPILASHRLQQRQLRPATSSPSLAEEN